MPPTVRLLAEHTGAARKLSGSRAPIGHSFQVVQETLNVPFLTHVMESR